MSATREQQLIDHMTYGRESISEEIILERIKQVVKWGLQDRPSLSCSPDEAPNHYHVPTEEQAKTRCDDAASDGTLSYAHILVEEVCEALQAPTEDDRREELLQCAAVCMSWVEMIDAREAFPEEVL